MKMSPLTDFELSWIITVMEEFTIQKIRCIKIKEKKDDTKSQKT